jgi:uncharacterized protein (DUF342 family)
MRTGSDKSSTYLTLEGASEKLSIEGETTEGGLKFFLDCKRLDGGTGSIIEYKELLGLLSEHIPDYFLHHDVIRDITECLNRGEEPGRRRVARGKAPVPGRPGKLLYLVKKFEQKGGRPDYLDLRLIRHFDNIEIGTVVARLYPPTKGIDGMDVFGKIIPAQSGAAVEIVADQTLERQAPKPGESFERLIAKSCGYIEEKEGAISVVDHLHVKGDLDYRIGDVDFVGSVDLKGDVMKGFCIKARGDITVHGSVCGGILISSGGSICVKGVVTGDQTADAHEANMPSGERAAKVGEDFHATVQIKAAGGVQASVFEGTSVNSKGSIEVGKEVFSSVLRTGAALQLGRGTLLGGRVFAVCGVEAKNIGTSQQTPTFIHLASDVESSLEFEEFNEQIKSHERALDMLRLFLGPYSNNEKAVLGLEAVHRRRILGLKKKLGEVEQSLVALRGRLEKLLSAARYNSVLRVNVHGVLYPGVKILVREFEFSPSEALKGPLTVEFLPEETRFKYGPMEPLICDLEPV